MAGDPRRTPPPLPGRLARDVPPPAVLSVAAAPADSPAPPPQRKITPSGMAYPALTTADGAVPIVLTWRTVLRLLGPTLALLLAGAAAVLTVVGEIRQHMADQQIHLARGERSHIVDRTALAVEIAKMTREIQLDQRDRAMQAMEQIDAALRRLRDEVAREPMIRRTPAPVRRTGSRR